MSGATGSTIKKTRDSSMVAVSCAMSPPDATLGAPLLAADLLEKLATPESKPLSIADTAPSTPQLVAGGWSQHGFEDLCF